MSILINNDSLVLVQGFTGKEGTFHSSAMLEYGTQVICGVTPGKGGMIHLGKPVFNTVKEAVSETGADVSVVFVAAPYAFSALKEAAEAGIKTLVCITEGIPVNDVIRAKEIMTECGCRLIGPNCPGIITPPFAKIGIMPGFIHKEGNIGIISRSGTLSYEAVYQLTSCGLGQSTCIGVGGDPVVGTTIQDALKLFMEDDDTGAVVIIGEIGGTMEVDAALWYKNNPFKPVLTYLAGSSAPAGKIMGHAGALISGKNDTIAEKKRIMSECGIHIIDSPAKIGQEIREFLNT